MKNSAIYVAVCLSSLAAFSASASPILLECLGEYSRCHKLVSGDERCDSPSGMVRLIEVSNDSITPHDDNESWRFTHSCEVSEMFIKCNESNYTSSPNGKPLASIIRSITIFRANGEFSGFSIWDKSNYLASEETLTTTNFKGRCLPRKVRSIF